MTEPDRAQRFREEVAKLRTRTDTTAVERRMLRAGWVLMALGVAVCLAAWLSSMSQAYMEDQLESIVLAISGLGLVVAGAAVFLRYSLGRFLRLWLLRLIYEARTPPDERQDAAADPAD